MGAARDRLIPLEQAAAAGDDRVGGKAGALARLLGPNWRVPPGFVITTDAYRDFLDAGDLDRIIRMELGRRPLDQMRWEEIWDTALRIRSAFLATEIPVGLADRIGAGVAALADGAGPGEGAELAVRSSAPGEDARDTSFAGLHESVIGVRGVTAVLDAVRIVWASLWSDAALLYRRELALDPAHSRMAVLVQRLVVADRSGVAFGRDPRLPARDVMIVEAVPGLCRDLVDGAVDPDRWLLRRDSGDVVEIRFGDRGDAGEPGPLLDDADLGAVRTAVLALERRLGWPPDVEWTGRRSDLTILQTRPITPPRPPASAEADDKRPWYLSLRPRETKLRRLCTKIGDQLIPALAAEGERLAAQQLDDLEDPDLAAAIRARAERVRHWRTVYWRDFIPFAHGVRRLAVYFNDAVRPADPYTFVGLLEQEDRLASRRNRELADLADAVRKDDSLRCGLAALLPVEISRAALTDAGGDGAFVDSFQRLLDEDLDIVFGGERLSEHPRELLRLVLQLAEAVPATATDVAKSGPAQLEAQLFEAVGTNRRAEAEEVLAIGRLSWRLRDDDNLLFGRLESQLLRAVGQAIERLRQAGRLTASPAPVPAIEHAAVVAQALDDPEAGPLELPVAKKATAFGVRPESGIAARQLTGQPGAPGLASGPARCIRDLADLADFRAGDILVCDAIQPSMTHVVPLAAAVVERRGGMLIHGVIIARELGLPCVNGIPGLLDRIGNGDRLTVDGYLGIVTVGEPELDLERAGD